MKVVVIYEENHGFIGLAKDYDAAIDFLMEEGWLDGSTEIRSNDEDNWVRLDQLYGPNWMFIIGKWNIDRFNDNIDVLQLEVQEVFGA